MHIQNVFYDHIHYGKTLAGIIEYSVDRNIYYADTAQGVTIKECDSAAEAEQAILAHVGAQ